MVLYLRICPAMCVQGVGAVGLVGVVGEGSGVRWVEV